jgi:hypothetical protein
MKDLKEYRIKMLICVIAYILGLITISILMELIK